MTSTNDNDNNKPKDAEKTAPDDLLAWEKRINQLDLLSTRTEVNDVVNFLLEESKQVEYESERFQHKIDKLQTLTVKAADTIAERKKHLSSAKDLPNLRTRILHKLESLDPKQKKAKLECEIGFAFVILVFITMILGLSLLFDNESAKNKISVLESELSISDSALSRVVQDLIAAREEIEVLKKNAVPKSNSTEWKDIKHDFLEWSEEHPNLQTVGKGILIYQFLVCVFFRLSRGYRSSFGKCPRINNRQD